MYEDDTPYSSPPVSENAGLINQSSLSPLFVRSAGSPLAFVAKVSGIKSPSKSKSCCDIQAKVSPSISSIVKHESNAVALS